jgi:hypothetical protein
MGYNLAIDEQLVDDALEYGSLVSVSSEVNSKLKYLINKEERMKILEIVDTTIYDEDYDYKKLRQLR